MRTRTKVILVGVVAVVALVGVGLFLFLGGDEPAEVDLETAADSVTETTAGGDETTTTAASEGADVSGTWSVDTESGEFDYESATGTFVGFRIQEELASIGATEAVGRTGDVTGSISIEDTTLAAADFEIDMSTITTNEQRRDDRVQDALETDQIPSASFALVEPVDLGEEAASGEDVTVTAVGDLTIHGVTERVELPIDARLVEDTVVVVGSLDIVFADYGVAVPESPAVVSAEDNGVLELQLLLVRA